MSGKSSWIQPGAKGMRISHCEYFPTGDMTLDELRRLRMIPDINYREFSDRKPTALLVDRRDEENIRVILVIQLTDKGKFDSAADKSRAIQECNELCQILKADIGVATDYFSYVWIDPNQHDNANKYLDKVTKQKKSYTVISNTNGKEFLKEFLNVAIQVE